MQLELEALETLPGAHVMQEVAAGPEYAPRGHALQTVPFRKLPAAQAAMAAPLWVE